MSPTMQGLQERLLSGAQGSSHIDVRHADRAGSVDVEEQEVIRRRMRTDKWTLDRGAGYYETERSKKKLACLVQTGKHAGRSRVRYVGVDSKTFWSHILRRDFYTTAVNAKLIQIVALLVVWYFLMLLSWSTVYYLIWRVNNSCFIGFHGFRSAFMYATETQQTIGYGERATGECWSAAVLVSIHSLQAVLLDSVILGIIFSRISHPKQRSRTVLISDCACIARRDGQLKFMFRVADIQMRSVIAPRVTAVMYTWGPGRCTAEGERIPVAAQDLSVSFDTNLLLPTTVEHTIDEASPLFGHTLQTLEAVAAEIVVTFEASSELGDTFMARQSYLPSELHWGHTFVSIIRPAPSGETQAEVDLSRFHDVEPQPGIGDEMTQPLRLSRKVVAGGGCGNVVPGRVLNENTLVLSEDGVVASRNGRTYLMFRLGDTFPGHVIDIQVTAHLYRWQACHTAEGELLPYEERPLPLEPPDLLLRYPVTLVHELNAASPVAHWATQRGMRQDADAEVVVVARGTLYSRQEVVTRTRVYSVLGDIKWGHAFRPVVLPGTSAAAPGASSKLGAAVDWSNFHTTAPITMPSQPSQPASGRLSPQAAGSPRHTSGGYTTSGTGYVALPDPLAPPPPLPPPAAATTTTTANAGAGAAGGGFGSGGAGSGLAAPGAGPSRGPSFSRLSRQSPLLHSPELSASGSSLSSLHHHQHHQLPSQLQHQSSAPLQLTAPAPAVLVPDPSAAVMMFEPSFKLSTLSLAQHLQEQAITMQQQQQQPQPQAQPSFQHLHPHPHHNHQHLWPPLQQRSPSSLLLMPGGGDLHRGAGLSRPASSTAFAAPGAVPYNRRTEDGLISAYSDDLDAVSSGGNSNSLSWGGSFWQYMPAGGTGSGMATNRPPSISGPATNTIGHERASERTWHQTRSLFSALENIQQYMQQQQEDQQQQQQHPVPGGGGRRSRHASRRPSLQPMLPVEEEVLASVAAAVAAEEGGAETPPRSGAATPGGAGAKGGPFQV